MRLFLAPAFLLLPILAGCAKDAPAAPGPTATELQAPAASSPPAAAPADSGDFPLVSSRGQQVADNQGREMGAAEPGSATAAGGTISGAGISFELPDTWQRQAPSSSMRMAQATIAGAGGEGQLAVFFFGPGGGGGVDANLDRWIGQVVAGPGETPIRDTFAVGNLKATWVELGGTLKASGFGMGPASDQPGQRLFGAVIEGPGGPWFFKGTGPEATMDGNREAFLTMLKSVRLGQ